MNKYNVRVYRPGATETGTMYDEFQIEADDVDFEDCGSIVFTDDDGEVVNVYPAHYTMFEMVKEEDE